LTLNGEIVNATVSEWARLSICRNRFEDNSGNSVPKHVRPNSKAIHYSWSKSLNHHVGGIREFEKQLYSGALFQVQGNGSLVPVQSLEVSREPSRGISAISSFYKNYVCAQVGQNHCRKRPRKLLGETEHPVPAEWSFVTDFGHG
jgi:hypothetical protein